MVKLAFLLIAVLPFSSCLNFEPYYDKEFYERISGIKFPEKAKAIESVDNGEFVTITVFNVDTNSLREFIGSYGFDTASKSAIADKPYITAFWDSYLKVNKPEIIITNKFYYKSDSKGENSWVYLVDMTSKKLWAQIQYPDWAGD